MLAQTEIYMDAIEHIPEGGTLRLNNVSWDDYEELLSQMENKPGYRISYDEGRLEVMSPRQDHERPKELISDFVRALADEADIQLEKFGSTTYHHKRKAKGAEPDLSFYVQNAELMEGYDDLDLENDPPPDVVVEIDTTNESSGKFKIYAALGVPEIWLYDGKNATFYQLRGKKYVETARSLAFPILTSDVLTAFLEQSKKDGQTTTLKAFRKWVRENK